MKKIAILFGINNYINTTMCLQYAIYDAKDMQSKLIKLGFETSIFLDCSHSEMSVAMANFTKKLQNYDVCLFFFAGHGFQSKNSNYFGTIDTSFEDEISAQHTGYSLESIIYDMEQESVKTKILIIDSCRNSPFSVRGLTRGFAPVAAPKGTLIGFGTSAGSTALEGNGHGYYTESILQHIETPKITIEEMFKRVRNTVSVLSKGSQITWEHTSLMGEFFFNDISNLIGVDYDYLDIAIADGKYTCSRNSNLCDQIANLRSHDYKLQNPVARELLNVNLNESDPNDLFVLGRNLYQCSKNAFEIGTFLQKFPDNLKKFGEDVQMHIINGMVFEIYFDRNGKIRNYLKTHNHELVFSLLRKNTRSYNFIVSKLRGFDQKIMYKPGEENLHYRFDIVISHGYCSEAKPGFQVLRICLDGQDVAYNQLGTDLMDINSAYFISVGDKQEFENAIVEATLIDIRNLTFNYLIEGISLISERFIFATDINLLRYSN